MDETAPEPVVVSRRHAIRLGVGAAAGMWLRTTAAACHDGAEMPPFARSRDAWGAAPSHGWLRPHRIERVTIHHTGPPSWFGTPPAPAYLRQIQAFHQGPERRWPDIAYHLLIDLDGTVWEGRPLGAAGDTATAYDPTGHALIAVLGDYDVQQPNQAQREAIVTSVRWLAERFAIDAGTVAGHRDYATTACPGRSLYALLAEIR
jgi:N-acetylmuramoyl-L-alanine amidase